MGQIKTKIKIYQIVIDDAEKSYPKEDCVYEQWIEGFDRTKVQSIIATFNDIRPPVKL